MRWNFFIKAKHCNYNINKKTVAITFDDGPNIEFTPKVLALLKKHQAQATFFCIGKNIEKHPDLIKQIIAQNHTVGNHSYIHANNYGFLKTKELIKDITKTQKLLNNINQTKNTLFRPPFGVTNPNIAKAIKKLDLQTIGWSIRSYDTIAKDANKVIAKITTNLQSGDIILLHDTSALSVLILEQLLQWLEKENYTSISVDKLLNS